ncbi:MAG: hypothetical protein WDN49_11745 [Acetobacteraceae bacterium]
MLLDGMDATADLAGSDRAAMLRVRRAMQYVFQDPMVAFNPRWTIFQSMTSRCACTGSRRSRLGRPRWRSCWIWWGWSPRTPSATRTS